MTEALMAGADFVAGDWGTSQLRLFLCDAQGKLLDSATGPGVAGSDGRCAQIFDSLVSKWTPDPHTLPAVLCGMVGSNIGWLQAPYVACPATLAEIATRGASLREGLIRIVPGLSCRNRFDAPDFMRGEETQILGVLALEPALRRGRQLLCLPGTHTKWVLLDEGVVTEFLTAPTGELFNLLSNHSVLVRERSSVTDTGMAGAFQRGLAQFERFPQAQLMHRLFECRSRSLDGELAPQDVAAFLSGLLIASDIAGALTTLGAARAVCLVGAPELTKLYAAGLSFRHCETNTIDGSDAALAGLTRIRRQLTENR
jgi:2-dehydro-3-deoxygalactonokinase